MDLFYFQFYIYHYLFKQNSILVNCKIDFKYLNISVANSTW